MRSVAIALAISLCVGIRGSAFAQAVSLEPAPPPLTLEDALAATAMITGSAANASELERDESIAHAAASSPAFGLSTALGQAPQGGSPAQSTLSEELTLNIGSRASRLGALRSAQAGTAQALASAAFERRTAARGVLTAFFAVANDQAQLAAATTNAGLAERSLAAAVQRQHLGVAPLIDVQRARTALATSQADVAASTTALADDRVTLAKLIGRPDVVAVALPSPSVIPDQSTATARALRTNPTIQSAFSGVRAAQAALLIAQGQQRSDVVVGAGVQLTRQGAATAVGPALTIGYATPLSSGLGRATVASAAATTLAAQTTLTQAQRDVVQAALAARRQAVSTSARVPSLIQAVAAAQSVADAELSGYRLGAVTSTDLILAQAQLATARNALATATVQASESAATLQLEIGALHL